MNRALFSGILFIVGGALLALLPYFLLPVCKSTLVTASGMHVPMKCFWTARAEIGVGALVAFGGLVYCLFRDAGVRFGIAVMIAGAALLALAFPTVLIGVCPSESMPCHMGTRPGLALVSAMILFVALAACWRLYRAMKDPGR